MGMHTWFECKIRYEKVVENGMQKKVTEPYLVDALSFTEAEARIIEEMTPFISGDLQFRTSSVPTTAKFSPATPNVMIVGLNASCASSHWMIRAEKRRIRALMCWYRLRIWDGRRRTLMPA